MNNVEFFIFFGKHFFWAFAFRVKCNLKKKKRKIQIRPLSGFYTLIQPIKFSKKNCSHRWVDPNIVIISRVHFLRFEKEFSGHMAYNFRSLVTYKQFLS